MKVMASVPRPDSTSIPDVPGAYLFRDTDGRVIYAGKALSLRKRLASYWSRPLHPRTEAMLGHASAVEWIVASTEVDALMLEYNLIKSHRPRFNVRYRDDKSYPYLAITVGEQWPRARVMRGPKRKGVRYFGPYGHAYAIRETLDALTRVFPVRTCSDAFFDQRARAGRPCLYYDIGRCAGPCVPSMTGVTEESYREQVDALADFLAGNYRPVLTGLDAEMRQAADATEFERAAKLRDQLPDARKLLGVVTQNAKEAFVRHKLRRASDFGARSRALADLGDALGLRLAPLRIECYDISNLGPTDKVGSMVVFEDGLPKRQDYRRFEIKGVVGQDDFACMEEVLERRFARLDPDAGDESGSPDDGRDGARRTRRRFAYPPALIVVDGGRGQLSVAERVLERRGLDIPAIGLAKRLEEVYVPGNPEPLEIPRGSEALFVLQHLRDEAHRFAITYHRVKRAKRALRSPLDDIPGVGETRRKALLRRFGSL